MTFAVRLTSFSFALLASTLFARPFVCAEEAIVQQPVVSTFAGSGAIGIADGPSAAASFMLPTSVAYAPNGNVYVTDAAAQRIRIVTPAGVVKTLAGSGPIDSTGLWVNGGYRDGSASQAKFNRPEGIAIDAHGMAFVADRYNRCIRRIAPDGTVTTFAGSPHAGSADGQGSAASFADPRSLAIDRDGNLYVADSGNGIRKITPGAAVTTLALPLAPDKGVLGIAARGAGKNLTIAYTDGQTIHFIAGEVRLEAKFDREIAPYNEARQLGFTFGLAIVGYNSVIATDLATNSVSFIRFDEQPFSPAITRRSFAAGRVDGSLVVGGYRDGPADSALMNDPFGVALTPHGDVLVADGGNRRIRTIAGVDVRGYLRPDLTNIDFTQSDFRIAVIGDSYLYNDVTWHDSIAGVLEDGLRKDRARLGIARSPKVDFTSISGASPSAQASFIENKFGDGEADAVILFLDAVALDHEFLEHPELRKADLWKTALPKMLRDLGATLQKNHTAFEIVVIPEGQGVSPSERGQSSGQDFPSARAAASEFESVIASSGVRTVRLLDPMLANERSARTILYNSYDHHLTIAGSIFTGRFVLDDFERWMPWHS